MVTISLELPDELARQLLPLQHRLPEIIELGLHQLAVEPGEGVAASRPVGKLQVFAALRSTGIVTLPATVVLPQARTRRTPVKAGGPLASDMIIEARHGKS